VPADGALTLRGYINLSDFTDIWTKVIIRSMWGTEFNLSEFFVTLMGFEASLQLRGFLHRTPTFVSCPRLYELSKHIPSLRVKNDLVIALNSNSNLLDLVKLVKPRKVDLKLTDGTSLIRSRRREGIESFEIFLHYLRDPNEIVWEVEVSAKLLDVARNSIDEVRVERAIDLMNLISEEIVIIAREQTMNS